MNTFKKRRLKRRYKNGLSVFFTSLSNNGYPLQSFKSEDKLLDAYRYLLCVVAGYVH